ncbi:MAG: 50S ribosomal protein L25 [Candidatus Moraniibacteriota bacterium]|nr:MAG: 50S ribosomal protein L25 [Candidatus Moranbacteria bacterium]
MSASIQLSVEERMKTGSTLSSIRKSGRIPAVLYGHGDTSQMVTVSALEFSRAYKEAGENTLVELILPKGKPINTLIYDVQTDPLSGKFLHVDFYRVRMNEKVEATVPLVFTGESLAVRGSGGVLVKALDEVEVSCLPGNIPHEFLVDIAALATFDDQIHVSDIAVPDGVEMLSDAEAVVALVERPRTDEEMASLDTKVEADVNKVEGVVKTEGAPSAEKKSE